MHVLACRTPALDANSWYYYALFCEHFPGTSLVAYVDDEFAAFVTGYMVPERPETLFLWQTASTLNHGVPNLGLSLLKKLVEKVQETQTCKYVEGTIDPANRAIAMQFRLLARLLQADSTTSVMFSAEAHPELEHDELKIRIGPIN
ncbi:GNAT family N-acetyltransferase [Kocuria marina]|uniref:GNAT family N-acetyltransferase n=1 Tax=Kocuria marina TaxID=223184 RepID=UPI00345F8556